MPADRTENERRFCLPPLEDRRSRSHFTILSRSQPGPTEVATQPYEATLEGKPSKVTGSAAVDKLSLKRVNGRQEGWQCGLSGQAHRFAGWKDVFNFANWYQS